MNIELSLSDELSQILAAIKLAEGEPLFVGGFVRDALIGHVHKDFDIEVYGLTTDKLVQTLQPFGRADQVGVSFGVIKLRTPENEYDFSLPRRENKQGQGHKGFIIEPDPTMTAKEAASRRDYTINAMALTLKGELLDYFGGLDDWKAKRLKHTSEKFAEDPLRVLRGLQFAGRFELTLDASTAKLAKTLKAEYKALSKERIWNEWQKWAEKSVTPSYGLKLLKQTEWLEFYPELSALIGLPQEPKWHPEGDVWAHTKCVVDEAAKIASRERLAAREKTLLIFATLCHDLGKAVTTIRKKGRWVSPGHASEGTSLSEEFLKRIHTPQHLIQHIKPLVKEHMSHLNQLSPRAIRRLALRLEPSNIDMLALLIEADASGRPPLAKGLPSSAKHMLELAKELKLEQSSPKPLLQGRHLINLAQENKLPEIYLQGGPHFSKLLEQVFQAQLDGEIADLESAKQRAIKLTTVLGS